MLGRVSGRLEGSAEGGVLGDGSALHGVTMVVHQVAQLGVVEDLPRACVFFSDVGRVFQPPEVKQNGLEELVIDGG